MMRRSFVGYLALALAAVSSDALAQAYPARTIHVISPFAPGGGTDYIARLISQKLGDANMWTVVVENKPGANGTLGIASTARADAAGYSLVVGQTDNLVFSPLAARVDFNPVTDFTPVAMIARTPMVFLAARKSPHRTFGDVIAAARAAPNTMTIGSSGTHSATHLTAELLRVKTGIQLRHVPYRGSAPALNDLLGGHLDIAGSTIASAIALIQSGDVRALAVTGSVRSPSLPDVPTLNELGIKEIDVSIWYGLLGPAGLPSDVKERLNSEVNKVIQRPEVVSALMAQGLEPTPLSPQMFSSILRRDVESWSGLISQLGIQRE